MDKFSLQNSQYDFPYHYIPHFSPRMGISRIRYLSWGMEYLCYQHHLKGLVEGFKPRSMLEVGCGDGYFVGMLDKSIARKGVDLSKEAIAFAKAFHPDVSFEAVPIDACEEQFDVVAAVEVLEHIPDEQVGRFLRDVAARVRPDGGRLVLSVPTTVVPLNKKHYRHYDRTLLEKQLRDSGAGLALEKIEYVYRESRVWTFYSKLTGNRYWNLELNGINRLMWKRIWERNRIASESNGRHLVAVLRRTVEG